MHFWGESCFQEKVVCVLLKTFGVKYLLLSELYFVFQVTFHSMKFIDGDLIQDDLIGSFFDDFKLHLF